MQDYRLIPMATPTNNTPRGKRPVPSVEASAQHFLEIFTSPLEHDVDADDALARSYAHAKESRGWK
jgi:hypothetical protein